MINEEDRISEYHRLISSMPIDDALSLPFITRVRLTAPHSKRIRHVMAFMVRIPALPLSEINGRFLGLVNSQDALRTRFVRSDSGANAVIHGPLSADNQAKLPLVQGSSEAIDSVVDEVLCNLADAIRKRSQFEELLWDAALVTCHSQSPFLCFAVDHELSDANTPRILSRHFNGQVNQLCAPEKNLRDFMKLARSRSGRMEDYRSTSTYMTFRQSIEDLFSMQTRYDVTRPVILSDPAFISYSRTRENSGSPLPSIIACSVRVIQKEFVLINVPLKIYVNLRFLGGMDFKDVIGSFVESLPCVLSKNRVSELDAYRVYMKSLYAAINKGFRIKHTVSDSTDMDILIDKPPFSVNYLGAISERDDQRYRENMTNFRGRLKFPILAYSVGGRETMIFNNGLSLSNEEIRESLAGLDAFDIEVHRL